MPPGSGNIDDREIRYFENHADDWWNPNGPLKALHGINPLRVNYIVMRAPVKNRKVLDIGCGGGILSEAVARAGSSVTGIDMAESALAAAREHKPPGLSIDYRRISAEALARESPGSFDVICCMELLEHIPDPLSMLNCCARLVKPGGDIFLSTVNRTPLARLLVIFAAEDVFGLVKKGTHTYDRFIRPRELRNWIESAGMVLHDCSGFLYVPVLNRAFLSRHPKMNYLVHAKKAPAGFEKL